MRLLASTFSAFLQILNHNQLSNIILVYSLKIYFKIDVIYIILKFLNPKTYNNHLYICFLTNKMKFRTKTNILIAGERSFTFMSVAELVS